MTYLGALAWTYALEAPVVMAAGWRWRSGRLRVAAAVILASGLTHPVAWWVAGNVPAEIYVWGWFVIEAAVCCVEAPVLGAVMRLPARRAWGLSILANGISAAAGWVLP
jgi:hypothetical protein